MSKNVLQIWFFARYNGQTSGNFNVLKLRQESGDSLLLHLVILISSSYLLVRFSLRTYRQSMRVFLVLSVLSVMFSIPLGSTPNSSQ